MYYSNIQQRFLHGFCRDHLGLCDRLLRTQRRLCSRRGQRLRFIAGNKIKRPVSAQQNMINICLSLISTVSLEAEHHRKPKGTNFGWGVSRAIIVVSSNKCCAMRSCSVCWMALNKCLKLTECNYIFMLLSICSTVTSHVLCPRCPGCPISECTDNVQSVIQNAYTTSPLSHFAFALRYQRWSRLLCAGLHSFDPLRSCPRFVFLEMLA